MSVFLFCNMNPIEAILFGEKMKAANHIQGVSVPLHNNDNLIQKV